MGKHSAKHQRQEAVKPTPPAAAKAAQPQKANPFIKNPFAKKDSKETQKPKDVELPEEAKAAKPFETPKEPIAPQVQAELEAQQAANPTKTPKENTPRSNAWRDIVGFLMNIVLTVVAVWAVFTFVFGVYMQRGEAMYPSLRDGDLVFFYRLESTYTIDDVLTFHQNGERYTARYVAMAGDIIDVDENGSFFINGNVQVEKIFYQTFAAENGITYPYEVPQGCVFLLGDFRTNAVDSRQYGAIPQEQIEGKLITFLRRRGI